MSRKSDDPQKRPAQSSVADAPSSKRKTPATRPKKAPTPRGDVPIELVAPDEQKGTRHDDASQKQRGDVPRGESLTDQRREHIPGELGTEVRPYLNLVDHGAPMDESTVHQTESKVRHPQGKTRNGVPQRSGK